jgi:hypothetical protein
MSCKESHEIRPCRIATDLCPSISAIEKLEEREEKEIEKREREQERKREKEKERSEDGQEQVHRCQRTEGAPTLRSL